MNYPFLQGNKAEIEQMTAVLRDLSKCETGKRLIDEAIEHQTTICFDGAMRAYGSYDEVKNVLRLNPSSSKDRLVATAAHELRHAEQFQKGILLDALLDTPKSYLQNQAVIEADASTTATLACYELAMKGNAKPLETLREKDPHIVNPFQNAAVQGGLENGEAQRAAFKGWFTDYSTRDCYDSLYLKMYEQRLRNASYAEQDKSLLREVPVEQTVAAVCSMSDGKPYLSEKETKEFFSDPDRSTVSYSSFEKTYMYLFRRFRLDYSLEAEGNMKKFGLTMRPSSSYMPRSVVPEPLPLPTSVEARQAAAAEKIAAARASSVAARNKKLILNRER